MRKNRLEAFSDGVIAIVITIMVLELKVPQSANLAALQPVVPVFLSYVLSFVLIAIYWNNHHHLLQLSQKVSGRVLLANAHLLFWLTLVPFTTGWMSENHFPPLPVAFYGGVLFFAGAAYFILARTLVSHHGLDSPLAAALGRDIKGKVSVATYAVAVPLAFVNAWVACALYVLVAIMWLVPDRRIEQTLEREDRHVHHYRRKRMRDHDEQGSRAVTADYLRRKDMSRVLQFVFAICVIGCAGVPQVASEQSVASRTDQPIWDGNKVEMIREQLAPGVFAFFSRDAKTLNASGDAAATSGGLIVGSKGALLIETMLNKRLFDQVQALTREVTRAPLLYAVNTSAHGDHSYGNMYLSPQTKVIQHENTKSYVEQHLADDKAFMIQNFGAGRGIEEIKARTGDMLVGTAKSITVDLGGKQVQMIDFGFAQTGGDLFVWEPMSKVLWTGNAVVASKPALPWLLAGHLVETLETLKKVYAFLPADARVIPGHGVAMGREDLRWHIDYLTAVKENVQAAIDQGLTLEQTVQKVKMAEFRGYALFDWVHPSLNVSAAYKDLSATHPTSTGFVGVADLIVQQAVITTLDEAQPSAQAVAVKSGKIVAVGSNESVLKFKGSSTMVVDAEGRRLIPGLNDSHSHYLRGGTSYNYELRWDGLTSLKQGLAMVRNQAAATPAGQWVRVVGGFTPWQFEERRMPTPKELTAASPNRPVYVQYFYSVVVMNRKALEALSIDRNTAAPSGTTIEKDAQGNPTGNFFATPSPNLFYSLLAKLPKASEPEAENGVQQLFHTLARFGLTSVIDAGGGGFNYPGDYTAPMAMVKAGKLPLRVSFYLFTQHPGKELEDYENWIKGNRAGQNLDEYREHGLELEGAGEWVLWKAGDYETFRSARPTQDADMEEKLEPIIALFVKNRWPFRIHATYDESVSRLLNVIEKVNAKTPLNGLRWSIEHGETLKAKSIDRIKALGGGVAVQDRMYFLGDDFLARYGAEEAGYSPPLRMLLDKGVPVGMGTDATRSSFNPWLGLYFLVTGKVASGATLLAKDNRLSREEALRIYSAGSAWFSQEETEKGRIKVGQLADFTLLSKDYMTVPDAQIKTIESLLTVVGGKPVYAAGSYQKLMQEPLPEVIPSWSPVKSFPGFHTAH